MKRQILAAGRHSLAGSRIPTVVVDVPDRYINYFTRRGKDIVTGVVISGIGPRLAVERKTMIADRNDENWLRAAARPLGDAAPVDRAAVARVRRAIAAGTYRVDPDGIAAAMIAADLTPVSDRD